MQLKHKIGFCRDRIKTNSCLSCVIALVKQVIPQSLSPPGTVPWQQQHGPPSPSSVSSGSTSPGYSPSRTIDLSGSSTSFSSERRAPHHWQNGPVQEWSKDQVKFNECLLKTNDINASACFTGLPMVAGTRA